VGSSSQSNHFGVTASFGPNHSALHAPWTCVTPAPRHCSLQILPPAPVAGKRRRHVAAQVWGGARRGAGSVPKLTARASNTHTYTYTHKHTHTTHTHNTHTCMHTRTRIRTPWSNPRRAQQFGLALGLPAVRESFSTPDHPLSLFQGCAGALAFLADLLVRGSPPRGSWGGNGRRLGQQGFGQQGFPHACSMRSPLARSALTPPRTPLPTTHTPHACPLGHRRPQTRSCTMLPRAGQTRAPCGRRLSLACLASPFSTCERALQFRFH